MIEEGAGWHSTEDARNMQSGVRSVAYNIFEQVLLNLHRKDVNEEKLDTQIVKNLDTDTAVEGLSKRFFTSSSFMEPIATLVRRKTNNSMDNNKDNVAYASEKLMGTVEPYNDETDSLPNGSEYESENPPRRNSSDRHFKFRHKMHKDKDVKRHSSSSKSSNEK